MTFKNNNKTQILLSLLLATSLVSCVSPAASIPNDSTLITNHRSNADVSTISGESKHNTDKLQTKANLSFISQKQAVELLSSKDDYINALSPFDWQAIYKSNHPLSKNELKTFYDTTVLEWDEESKKKVNVAVELLHNRIAVLPLNTPNHYKFILSNGADADDSAYTREDYIVLPTYFLDDSHSQAFINQLVAHEFFHLYSRYNKIHRDKLFAPIHFYKVPPVALTDELNSLRITNPDAPHLDYAIDLKYQHKQYTFVPTLQSIAPYNKEHNFPFLFYLTDGLLAVEPIEGLMRPVLNEGEPIYVDKSETNYDEIVRRNSSYVSHPEEVSAENFSLWVVEGDIKHQEPVDRLIEVMKTIH